MSKWKAIRAARTRGAAWTPEGLADLVAWYDADAAYVTTIDDGGTLRITSWEDRSVSAKTLTPPADKPAWVAAHLGGHGAVYWDGNYRSLTNATNMAIAEVWMAIQPTLAMDSLGGIGFGNSYKHIRVGNTIAWRGNGQAGEDDHDFTYGGAMYLNGSLGNTHNNAAHVLQCVSPSQRNTYRHFGYGDFSNRSYGGYLMEFLAFSSAQEAGTRALIKAYLAQKYGITVT